MSDRMDDLIFRMVEETFSGVKSKEEGCAQLNPDFELIFQCERKCFLFKSLEIPANFGPFKRLTEGGLSELRILPEEEYFDDLSLIFEIIPSSFLFTWDGQTLKLHCEVSSESQAA